MQHCKNIQLFNLAEDLLGRQLSLIFEPYLWSTSQNSKKKKRNTFDPGNTFSQVEAFLLEQNRNIFVIKNLRGVKKCVNHKQGYHVRHGHWDIAFAVTSVVACRSRLTQCNFPTTNHFFQALCIYPLPVPQLFNSIDP